MPDIKEQIKQAHETYDKFAKIHAEHIYQKIPQFQLNEFISMLKGKKILDAACGPGRDVRYFLEENLEPVGVDKSSNMLEEAKERVPKGSFQQMDLTDLRFLENDFDGVWCMSSLTTLPDEDVKITLKQFFKVLKKEGVLYVCIRKGQGQEVVQDPRYEDSIKYYNKFTKEKIREFLEEAGFKIIKIRTDIVSHEKHWIEVFATKQ